MQIIVLSCFNPCWDFPVYLKSNSQSPVWPTWFCFLLLFHLVFSLLFRYSNHTGLFAALPLPTPSYQYYSLFRVFTLFAVWQSAPLSLVLHTAVSSPLKSPFKCHFLREPFSNNPAYNSHTYLVSQKMFYPWTVFCFLYSTLLNDTICLFRYLFLFHLLPLECVEVPYLSYCLDFNLFAYLSTTPWSVSGNSKF